MSKIMDCVKDRSNHGAFLTLLLIALFIGALGKLIYLSNKDCQDKEGIHVRTLFWFDCVDLKKDCQDKKE